MRTFKLRNGQWLKFRLPEAGRPLRAFIPPDAELAKSLKRKLSELPALVPATIPAGDELASVAKTVHRTADGCFVGIYAAEGSDPLSRRYVPGHVVAVKQTTGLNIRFLRGSEAVLLALDPDGLIDLQPCTSRDEIPADRLQHTPAEWQPR